MFSKALAEEENKLDAHWKAIRVDRKEEIDQIIAGIREEIFGGDISTKEVPSKGCVAISISGDNLPLLFVIAYCYEAVAKGGLYLVQDSWLVGFMKYKPGVGFKEHILKSGVYRKPGDLVLLTEQAVRQAASQGWFK